MIRLSDRIIRHTLDNLDTKSVALEVLSLEEKIEALESMGSKLAMDLDVAINSYITPTFTKDATSLINKWEDYIDE